MARGILRIEEGDLLGGARLSPQISQAAAALTRSSNIAAAGRRPGAIHVQRVARAVAASPRLRQRPVSRRIFWS